MTEEKREFDITYKVLVIGESTVGKTSLIRMFSHPDEELPASLLTTIGIDFVNVIREVDDIRIRLQIWDTAGQERFRTFTKLHFRGTKGLILMYDITNSETFDKLTTWLKDIECYGLGKEQLIIVGNKTDLEIERQVSKKSGERIAYEYGFKFFETSAKDNVNVQEVFQQLTTDMKDANDPYFVPIIPDPRFSLEVARIEVVDGDRERLRVVDDGDTPAPVSSKLFSSCCGN